MWDAAKSNIGFLNKTIQLVKLFTFLTRTFEHLALKQRKLNNVIVL